MLVIIGRSREGAWIEIALTLATRLQAVVAPARERGLKSYSPVAAERQTVGRSREGAWIEILLCG